MRLYRLIYFAFIFYALLACGDGADRKTEGNSYFFDQDISYRHLISIFSTEQECMDSQNLGFFINCWQTVDFYIDGTAIVMVTDIINPATYIVDDMLITVSFPTVSEISEDMYFYLSEDHKTLIEASSSSIWSIVE